MPGSRRGTSRQGFVAVAVWRRWTPISYRVASSWHGDTFSDHVLAFVDWQPVVEELLAWGATPFETDEWGASPLHLIMATASHDTVPIADRLEVRTVVHSFTLLLAPVGCRLTLTHYRLGSLLKTLGCCVPQAAASACGSALEIDKQDIRGCTPLHYAAATGDMAALQWLLQRGASPFAVDHEGYTAEVTRSPRFSLKLGYAHSLSRADALAFSISYYFALCRCYCAPYCVCV